ncbi:MAG: C4-dicarboxylate ABC transporter [Geminicoccaceae bacterium]|nr:MAG: C4-dicarboxylate ABC transporter [Geminicoccaceae bacterium]
MPPALVRYVRFVDALNRTVGRVLIWTIFAFLLLLLYASFSRTVLNVPLVWSVETAQFLLAAYFLLGGGWSLLADAHVRMDLLYARWSPRTRAFADSLTAFCLFFYLAVMLIGGMSSTHYAIVYDQRNYSAWAPPLAPIKIVMVVGLVLIFLQAVALFIRDLARWRGRPLPEDQRP